MNSVPMVTRRPRTFIEPDTFLPCQQAKRYALPCDGERRLLLAVFEDAVKVLTRPHMVRAETLRDAQMWLESDVDWGVFSFVGMCEVFGLAPSAVRKGIAEGNVALPGHSLRRVDTIAPSHVRAAEWHRKKRLRLAQAATA